MGLLSYAVAGGIKGAADTYLDISKEERADKRQQAKEERADTRDIAKEGRQQDIWEKRQEVLRKNKVEDQINQNEFTLELEGIRQEGQNTRNQATIDAANARNTATIKGQKERNDDNILSSEYIAEMQDETKRDLAEGKKDGELTPKEIAKQKLDITKYIGKAVNDIYKIDDMSTMDEATRETISRVKAVSSKLAEKNQDIDLHTIVLRANEFVTSPENASRDINSLISQIQGEEKKWFPDQEKLSGLQDDLSQAQGNRYSTQTPNLGEGGMLSMDTGQQPEGAPPVDLLVEGKKTRFKNNGQVWMLKDGKPVRVE